MADPILEANGLTRYYKGQNVPALDRLDINAPKGKIFTILGRNGAGKTTFVRVASTQLLPTSGSIEIFGLDAVKNAKEIRRRISIVPQEARALSHMTPSDHILLSLAIRGVTRKDAHARAKDVLHALDLTEYQRIPSDQLSGGLRQRILIGMTIACDVDLMFLDEPTIGLDPIGRRKVWGELTRLKHEEGRTIILTTHYLDEAEVLSDELLIIDRGRALVHGTLAEVRGTRLSSKVRIDVGEGFSMEELQSFGAPTRVGNVSRIFVSVEAAEELSKEALKRKAMLSMSPITLDDVFVDIVGTSIDNETGNE